MSVESRLRERNGKKFLKFSKLLLNNFAPQQKFFVMDGNLQSGFLPACRGGLAIRNQRQDFS